MLTLDTKSNMNTEQPPKKLPDFDLNSIIASTTDLVLVLFTSDGSGLGYIEESNLAELPKKLVKSISIYKLDYEKHKDVALTYNIRELPTLLFFHGKTIIDKIVGLHSKAELISIIQLNLERAHFHPLKAL